MLSAVFILALLAIGLLLELRRSRARIKSLEAQNASLRRLHSGANERYHVLLRESMKKRV